MKDLAAEPSRALLPTGHGQPQTAEEHLMELGNMIFGNSRGEFPVPRDETFEEPWDKLCEALKINHRGYADDGCLVPEMTSWSGVENGTFSIRAYDWDAECDCGAKAKMDRWFGANPHGPECYQTELHARLKSWEGRSGYARAEALAFGDNDDGRPLPGMNMAREDVAPGVMFMSFAPRSDAAMEAYNKLRDRRGQVERKLFDELCSKHGVDRKFGCMVHCTCGRGARGDLFWQNVGGHADDCRLTQPNFLFKPTGFRLNWYKYPFRDSYMSDPLTPDQWREIMGACIASATDLSPAAVDRLMGAPPPAESSAADGGLRAPPLTPAPADPIPPHSNMEQEP
jgi:hypothetical protein